MKKYDIVIIGGDAAGMSAASQARRTNGGLSIIVLEKGRYVSYAACGLPYYIADVVKEPETLVAIDVDEFIKKRNIEIRFETEVISVDFPGKTVTARSDTETISLEYEKLIIGTGARAVSPPIPGIDIPNVFFLRNLAQGILIKEFLDRNHPRSGIIIGGGLIGLEMAEALRKRSIDVTLLEKFESVAMPMSPEIRDVITRTLLANNVGLHTSVSITEIRSSGKGLSVVTDGKSYQGDFVLVSTGIVPNTEFLRGSGIAMTDRGAIIVDEKSRTSVPDVYAAGDCATVKSVITGRDIYMPLGTIANKQGRVAGLQAAGVTDELFRGSVGSQMVKVFDLEVGKTGMNLADAAREGIRAETASVKWVSRASYYPSSQEMVITLTIDADSRALIGGEIAGTDGAALRTNVIAAAVHTKMKIDEIAYLDLGYAPPFSPVWDPVNAAAQKLVRRKTV